MLTNRRLGTKLAIGFGLITILLLLLGGIALANIRSLSGHIVEIAVVRLPSIEGLLMMRGGQTDIDASENALLYAKASPELVQAAFARMAEAEADTTRGWNLYEPLPQTPEEAELWGRFKPAWAAWQQDHQRFTALARAYWNATERKDADYVQLAEQALLANARTYSAAAKMLDELVHLNSGYAAAEQRHSTVVVARANWVVPTALAVGVIAAIVLALIITRGITRPIAVMRGALARVAEGDLTTTTGITRGDEIGRAHV